MEKKFKLIPIPGKLLVKVGKLLLNIDEDRYYTREGVCEVDVTFSTEENISLILEKGDKIIYRSSPINTFKYGKETYESVEFENVLAIIENEKTKKDS